MPDTEQLFNKCQWNSDLSKRKQQNRKPEKEGREVVGSGRRRRGKNSPCGLRVFPCSPHLLPIPNPGTTSTRNLIFPNHAKQAMLIESFSPKTAILTSKINAVCGSLTLAVQEEPKGRSRASSAKLLRFRSQSPPHPHGCTKAILLMQQVRTAKG